MGIWFSGHFKNPCSGVYGNSTLERCSYSAAFNKINTHVAAGTIIHSDEWVAYNRVQRLSNVTTHEVVNHSVNFVEPTTGVHTQNVESYWNRVKKLKRMKGCHGDQLPSYLFLPLVYAETKIHQFEPLHQDHPR